MVVRGEQEYWVPAVPQHLRRVDLQARRVVVDWDARGGLSMRIAVVSLFPQMIREALQHRRGRPGTGARGLSGRVLRSARLHALICTARSMIVRMAAVPGMVLKVEPMRSAVRDAMQVLPPGSRRVYLGADGRRFEQRMARDACDWPGLVLGGGTI